MLSAGKVTLTLEVSSDVFEFLWRVGLKPACDF
jgi:hypothetical protein